MDLDYSTAAEILSDNKRQRDAMLEELKRRLTIEREAKHQCNLLRFEEELNINGS